MAVRDITLNEALPDNLDAERFVLGAIMSNDSAFLQVAGTLAADDFNLEKHKRIFLRMGELHERGERIDRVTLANELMKHGQLQSVDGLSYLVSLDDGLPTLHNLDSYVTIVKEKSLLRRIISVSQDTINRCLTCDDDASRILGAVEDALMKLGDVQSKNSLASPAQIITEYEGGINAFLDTSKRIKGTSTGFLKFDEMTGGLREGELFILAARPAMGKCLAADSEIIVSDGTVKTIQEVFEQGEAELLTLEENGKLRFASPSAFVDDGIKPVFRVTTRLGRAVDSTLAHPFLTFQGWKKLVDLKPGDTIAVPRIIPVFGERQLPEEHAKILGYLLGDGCLTDGTPEFTNADPRLRDDFIGCLSVFDGVRYRIEDSGGSRTPTVCIAADREAVFEERARFAAALTGALARAGRSDRSLALELDVSPSLVCQWKQARCVPVGETPVELCRALGLSSGELFPMGAAAASQNSKNALTLWLESMGLWGKSAAKKFVPEIIFSSTRKGIATVLNRLFATDGWASVLSTGQAQLGFATISERLARQVQHLLLRFGIVASLRRKSVLYGGTRRRAWQLNITDAESISKFLSEIGIFGKERAVARVTVCLANKKPHSNRDLFPKDVWKQIELAKGDLSWGELARLTGSKTAGHNLHAGKREVSRRRLSQFADVLQSEPLRALATSDLSWDQIVSIEYLGQKQVYDLTIPETHNFIANDVCVHNTALALNIAQHIAENPKNPRAVAVFSLEMSKESLLTRMLCASARVDQQRFRAGYLNGDERRSLQDSMYKMVEAPLFLDDTAGTNLMDVHSKLRRLQAEQDLGLVIIDYLQLMQGRGRFENRVQEISSLSRGLKLMSKELRVPFLVLSQLSRAPESRPGDHRPMLSDLRESGSIEQDADLVAFIFREEVYRPDKESLKGVAELILAKQRNGPTGRVKLAFLNRYTKFENLSADTGDDDATFE
jgi:replicative DNA helicase